MRILYKYHRDARDDSWSSGTFSPREWPMLKSELYRFCAVMGTLIALCGVFVVPAGFVGLSTLLILSGFGVSVFALGLSRYFL